MALCGAGFVSHPKATSPKYVILTPPLMRDLVIPFAGFLAPLIATMPDIALDTSVFCATDPPGFPVWSEPALFALGAWGGAVGDVAAGIAAVSSFITEVAWYQLCECVGTATPAMPAPPATPTNVPTYQLTITGNYGATVLADNPQHYWRCADPAGNILHDIGRGVQRALQAVGQPGIFAYSGPASDGGSVWMDANSGAWHFTSDTVQSPFSIEAWVWIHSSKTSNWVVAGHFANLQINPAETVMFASGGPNVNSPASITENAWHHLVGTYGPTGGAKLYVDGVNVVTGAYAAAWGPSQNAPTIGMSDAGTLFGVGNIAEVATYNYELIPAQVLAHFNAADTRNTRPVARSNGSWNATVGSSGAPTVIGGTADLSSLQAAVRLLQRQLVPFGYVNGTVQAGLSGNGSIPVSSLFGIRIDLTTIPGSLFQDTSNPPFIFNGGWVSAMDINGFIAETRVHAQHMVWSPHIMSEASVIGYSFSAGVVATITQLLRQP